MDVMVSPSSMARNLGVILDNRPLCAPKITVVAWSCRFALYNICRIQFFLTKDATQLLVISRLDYCNSLLAGLPTSATSTGFLLQSESDSRRWCWPSRPSSALHPSTSKHWSDHTPPWEHFAHLHQLAGWYSIVEIKQSPLSKVATLLCFGTSVVGRSPDKCQDSGITLHLPQKTQDSSVQTSPWPSIAWLPPRFTFKLCYES